MSPTSGMLDRMPDAELIGHTLDLGRPELAGVMRRYRSDLPRPQTSMLEPPAVLIVPGATGADLPVRNALESDGWFVKTCAGPGARNCPLLRGERCQLRASVDAAVVYVDPTRLAGGLGSIPRVRCAADSASPGIIALEGCLDQPKYARWVATVGARRGPRSVLTAISILLARK